MKRIVLAALAVLLVFTCACELQKNAVKKNVVLIVKSVDPTFEFWQQVKKGAETAAKEFGADLTFTGPSIEDNVDEQIEIVQQYIERKPDAIALAACDRERLTVIAQDVLDAGIKLITVDSDIETGVAASFVGTDNETAAAELAKRLLTLVPANEPIAVISFVPVTSTAILRETGFLNEMKARGASNILGPYYSGDSSEAAYELARKLLLSQKISGIYATNAISSEGVACAVAEVAPGLPFVAFDSTTVQNQYLENGIISMLAVQRPFNMGYLAVKAAIDAVNGKQLEKHIDTGFVLVTRENMQSEEIQKLIYPF